MRRIAFALLGVVLSVLAAASTKAHADDAGLPEIEALFAAGDFEGTARKVNELLIRDFDLSPDKRAAIYLMKARLEFAFDRPAELRLWLTKAFQTDPTLALDPVKDPPKLIAVYDEVRGIAPKDPDAKRERSDKETVDLKDGDAYWKGLMPFGIGHFHADMPRDGALFLSSELLAVLATATLPDPENGGRGSQRFVFGTTTFAAIYGYELLDMTAALASRDPASTGRLRYALSYFPLGVAQAKNRQPIKAWSFAIVQSALVSAAALAPEPEQRQGSLALLIASLGYGLFDGLKNHSDALAGSPSDSKTVAWQLLPVGAPGERGAVLQVSLRL